MPLRTFCDSWEEGKISILTGVSKKLIPTFVDDRGVQDFCGGVSAEVVEIARGLKLEWSLKMWLNCYILMINYKLFPMDEQRMRFLEKESTPGEDTMKTAEMTRVQSIM